MKEEQIAVEVVPISLPPKKEQVKRNAQFAGDKKKTRYHLPEALDTYSPVGYRTRVSFTEKEAAQLMPLLGLQRPDTFVASSEPTEQELFEESSLGVLSSRQSTNYLGHKQITLGLADSATMTDLLQKLNPARPLKDPSHTHILLTRPYRTPFTMLLTFIGHRPFTSLATVPIRAFRKTVQHIDDMPTVGYLQHVHAGILADTMERATVIASGGKRRANIIMEASCGQTRKKNRKAISQIESFVGLTQRQRAAGWRIAFVAQIGAVPEDEISKIDTGLLRKFGANLLAFRSERIQPGINQEESAPPQYQERQSMTVPDELTVQCGRAAYNAFVHWTGCDRERSKQLMLMERVDVLTPNGKQRLRDIRGMLDEVTDRIIKNIPLWADLATNKALSRNAARGKKAFALAGQRIYIGGLDEKAIEQAGLNWELSIRAFGAASARSALVAELMGCVNLPETCDLLAGICLMAGPINQNDIGKTFYGHKDILASTFPDKNPTSLLVWTLKAKTVADPIGNEEQLMNAARKGALVDLRPGPHEVVEILKKGSRHPLRSMPKNRERAFSDIANFASDPDHNAISGNAGEKWKGNDVLWP